jgi:hypothetical protein
MMDSFWANGDQRLAIFGQQNARFFELIAHLCVRICILNLLERIFIY